jgi:hypothetical protein
VKYSIVFFVFGILYFCTYIHFSNRSLENKVEARNVIENSLIKHKNTTETILHVQSPQATFYVEVSIPPLPVNEWTFVEGKVYDEKNNYLFGFGKELWAESGIEEGETWTEDENSYSTYFYIDKPGKYIVRFEWDGSYVPKTLSTEITPLKGYARLHGILSMLCFLIFGLYFIFGLYLLDLLRK